MRARAITTGVCCFLLAAGAPRVMAQLAPAGDLDASGRVMTRVRVTMTDSAGVIIPISRVKILVVTELGQRQEIVSGDNGIAWTWLNPDNYRLVTPDPVRWRGSTYAWDTVIAIRPGTGVINFSEATATLPAAAPSEAGPAGPPGGQARQNRVRVYIDCETTGCDLDYFKSEIPFVDHMRDRTDASVHMLVTSAATGGGGLAYSINFLGQRDQAGVVDTLHLNLPANTSADQKRAALARTMKLGLVRYVARTPDGGRLRVGYNTGDARGSQAAAPERDPWNLWVFKTTASAAFDGEKSQHSLSLRGSTSANRTSEAWKVRLAFNGGYDESKYTLSDGSEYGDYTHSYGGNQLIVRSIGRHWAIGEKAAFSSSTYLNQKLVLRFAPTIEFNFFPYSESTRRRFTVAYAVGINSFTYEDTTIFDKLEEVRPDQSVTAILDFRQPWGSASLVIEGAALLDDFSKHHASFYNELDVRLFKGFSFNTYVGVELTRDQLYLAKGDLTDEQILLRRRRLASRYYYYGGFGLSYTFGSIFNNVVNTRFDGVK